jgi:hypothetical protein
MESAKAARRGWSRFTVEKAAVIALSAARQACQKAQNLKEQSRPRLPLPTVTAIKGPGRGRPGWVWRKNAIISDEQSIQGCLRSQNVSLP